jgi:hypothetical protein
MSYFKENHSVKKIMKTSFTSSSASSGTTATFTNEMFSNMGSNYSDEILWGTGLICPNKLKGFFIFQGNCRLTVFNSNFTAIRLVPFFSSNQTTTAIKNMQSGVPSIRDNTNLLYEGYPSLATCFSNSVDFTNSTATYSGASANKSSGNPELWLLPIGENT